MNRKEYMKQYNSAYNKSIKGLVRRIYHHQVRNCSTRNHPLPTYSIKELTTWCLASSTFVKLYDNWVNSNYCSELTPSLDRLNNSVSYTFSNIEPVTWKENKKRAAKAISDNILPNTGLLNDGHVEVTQFSLEGKELTTFISVVAAAKSVNGVHQGVSDACREKKSTYKQYIWMYSSDKHNFHKKYPPSVLKNLKRKAKTAVPITGKITFSDGTVQIMTTKELATYLNVSTYTARKAIINETYNSPLIKTIKNLKCH